MPSFDPNLSPTPVQRPSTSTTASFDVDGSDKDLLLLDIDADDDSSARTPGSESERDELKEVQKLASTETWRVVQWRRVALFMIFAAGASVSYMTFAFLDSEEDDNHREAVSCHLDG